MRAGCRLERKCALSAPCSSRTRPEASAVVSVQASASHAPEATLDLHMSSCARSNASICCRWFTKFQTKFRLDPDFLTRPQTMS